MTFKERKYAMASEPGFKRQVGGSRLKAVKKPKPDDSESPLQAQIRVLKEKVLDLSGSSTEKEAKAICAELGDLYSLDRRFHLAGVYYKKAGALVPAGNAFMAAKEYFSAARCLETAGEKKLAKKAYKLAARQEMKSCNYAVAICAYRKAGKLKTAKAIEDKMLEKAALAKKRLETKRKNAVPIRHPSQMGDLERYEYDKAMKGAAKKAASRKQK